MAAAAPSNGDLYRWARRFRSLTPEEMIPKYIDSIAFAVANSTPQTAYDTSLTAIAKAIVTATYSCHPGSREATIKQILASVKYKDMGDVMIAVQLKKIEVMKDTCERMSLLPDEVKDRVATLVQLQEQHDDLKKKMLATAQAEEADLSEIESLHEKRRAIVSCDSEAGGVPTFWLLAMMAVKQLREEITEDDELALKYLTDVKCDAKGLRFEFFFDPNPFFKNAVLIKEYSSSSDRALVSGTDIRWTQCLTHTTVQSRLKKCINCQGNLPKRFGRKSFFNFFYEDEAQDVVHDRLIRDALGTMFSRAVTCFLDSGVVREEIQAMEAGLEEMMI